MMRLTRALDTLANGGSYQQEVLRFLEEIIEVLEKIEIQGRPMEIKLEKKEEICPEASVEVKKVAKKCGRPKGWSPKKKNKG